jgi:large conductance mechanosensitive channel
MPLMSTVGQNVDFSNLYVPLSDKIERVNGVLPALVDARKMGAVFAYGNFITVVINFTIMAFIIFLMVKAMNNLKKKEEAKPAPTPADVVLLTEIRDLLKK